MKLKRIIFNILFTVFLFTLTNKNTNSSVLINNQFIPRYCKPKYIGGSGSSVGHIIARCPTENPSSEDDFYKKIAKDKDDYVNTFFDLNKYKITNKGTLTQSEQGNIFADLGDIFICDCNIPYLNNAKTGVDARTDIHTGALWMQDLKDIGDGQYSVNICRNAFDFYVQQDCVNVNTKSAVNRHLFYRRMEAAKYSAMISVGIVAVLNPIVAAAFVGLMTSGTFDAISAGKSGLTKVNMNYVMPGPNIYDFNSGKIKTSEDDGDMHPGGYVYQLFNNKCPYDISASKAIDPTISGFSSSCIKTSNIGSGLHKRNNCRLLVDDMIQSIEKAGIKEDYCICDSSSCNDDFSLKDDKLKELTTAKDSSTIECYSRYRSPRLVKKLCQYGVEKKNNFIEATLNDVSLTSDIKYNIRGHYGPGSYVCGYSDSVLIGCMKVKSTPPPIFLPRICTSSKVIDARKNPCVTLFTEFPYVRPFSKEAVSSNYCPSITGIPSPEVGDDHRGTFLSPKAIIKYGDNEQRIQYNPILFNSQDIFDKDRLPVYSNWQKDIVEKKRLNRETCTFYEDAANFDGDRNYAIICSRFEYDDSSGKSDYVIYSILNADKNKTCSELYDFSEENILKNKKDSDKILFKIGQLERPPLKYNYLNQEPNLPIKIRYYDQVSTSVESNDSGGLNAEVVVSFFPSKIYSDVLSEKDKIRSVRSRSSFLSVPVFKSDVSSYGESKTCAVLFLHRFCVKADICTGFYSIKSEKRKNPSLCPSSDRSMDCVILNNTKNVCSLRYNCSQSTSSLSDCESKMSDSNAIKLDTSKSIDYYQKIKQFQGNICVINGIDPPTQSIIDNYGNYGDKSLDYVMSYRQSSDSGYTSIGFKMAESKPINDYKNMLSVDTNFVDSYLNSQNVDWDILKTYLSNKKISTDSGLFPLVNDYYLKKFCSDPTSIDCLKNNIVLRRRDPSEFGLCVDASSSFSFSKVKTGASMAYVPLRCNYTKIELSSGGGGGTAIRGTGNGFNKAWRDDYDQPGSSGTYASFILNNKVHDIDLIRFVVGKGDSEISVGNEKYYDPTKYERYIYNDYDYYAASQAFSNVRAGEYGYTEDWCIASFGYKSRLCTYVNKWAKIKDAYFQTAISSTPMYICDREESESSGKCKNSFGYEYTKIGNYYFRKKSNSGVVGVNSYKDLRFNYVKLDGGVSNGIYMFRRAPHLLPLSAPLVKFIDDIRDSNECKFLYNSDESTCSDNSSSYFSILLSKRGQDFFGFERSISTAELGDRALIYSPLANYDIYMTKDIDGKNVTYDNNYLTKPTNQYNEILSVDDSEIVAGIDSPSEMNSSEINSYFSNFTEGNNVGEYEKDVGLPNGYLYHFKNVYKDSYVKAYLWNIKNRLLSSISPKKNLKLTDFKTIFNGEYDYGNDERFSITTKASNINFIGLNKDANINYYNWEGDGCSDDVCSIYHSFSWIDSSALKECIARCKGDYRTILDFHHGGPNYLGIYNRGNSSTTKCNAVGSGQECGCEGCGFDSFRDNDISEQVVGKRNVCFLKSRQFSGGGCISQLKDNTGSVSNDIGGVGYGGDGIGSIKPLKLKKDSFDAYQLTNYGNKVISSDSDDEYEETCKLNRCAPQNLVINSAGIRYLCEYSGDQTKDYEFEDGDTAFPKRCFLLQEEGGSKYTALSLQDIPIQHPVYCANSDYFENVYSANYGLKSYSAYDSKVYNPKENYLTTCLNKICYKDNGGSLILDGDKYNCKISGKQMNSSLFESLVNKCKVALVVNDVVMNKPFNYDRYNGVCVPKVENSFEKKDINKLLSDSANMLYFIDQKNSDNMRDEYINGFEFKHLPIDVGYGNFVKQCVANMKSNFYKEKSENGKLFSAVGLEDYETISDLKNVVNHLAILVTKEDIKSGADMISIEERCAPLMQYNKSLSPLMNSIVAYRESNKIRNSTILTGDDRYLSEIDPAKVDFYDFRYTGNASWSDAAGGTSDKVGLCLTNYISYDDSGKLKRDCVSFYGRWGPFRVYDGDKKNRQLPCLLTCDVSADSIDDTVIYDYGTLKNKRIIKYEIDNGYGSAVNNEVDIKVKCPTLRIKDYKGDTISVATYLKSGADYGERKCFMPAISSPYYYGYIDNYQDPNSPKIIVNRDSNESCALSQYVGEYNSADGFYYGSTTTPSSYLIAACTSSQLTSILSQSGSYGNSFIFIDGIKYLPKPKKIDSDMITLKPVTDKVINFYAKKIRIACDSISKRVVQSETEGVNITINYCNQITYEIMLSDSSGNPVWKPFYRDANGTNITSTEIFQQFISIFNHDIANKARIAADNLLSNYKSGDNTYSDFSISSSDSYSPLLMIVPIVNFVNTMSSDLLLNNYNNYKIACSSY